MPSYHTRRTHLPFLGTVAAGAGGGIMIGLIYIWQIDFSLSAFLAALVGGSVTGANMGTFVYAVERPSDLAIFTAGLIAGAAGGAAWWAVAGPTISLAVAVGIGAGIVFLLMIAAKLDLPI